MGKKRKKAHGNQTQKKEVRLRKARQWVLAYNGTPKHMARHYRKRFHVDITTAVSDLKEIGVEFTQEYLDAVKRSEEERIRQKHLKKQQEQETSYEFSDNRFAFIAGYTDGGAAYGTTWEELGVRPYAPYEELMEAYDRLDREREQELADWEDEDEEYGDGEYGDEEYPDDVQ